MMSSLWMDAVVALSTLAIILLLLRPTRHIGSSKQVSVQVLVLGDIARSPRMRYHATSIAEHGGRVELIGFLGIFDKAPILFQL